MARIFISYSRVDKSFVEELAAKLRRIYGYDNVWFDEGLHGGDIWWEEILDQIEARDIFLYVLSNESVQSKYCKAEFEEARRLQKQIITVQARDRTKFTEKLGDIHYIDMAHDPNDASAFVDLVASVNKRERIAKKRKLKPLWEPRTPKPSREDEKPRPDNAPDVETPALTLPKAELERPAQQRLWWKKPEFLIGAILIPIIAAIIGGLIQNPGFFGLGGEDATDLVQAPTSAEESARTTDTPQPIMTTGVPATDTPSLLEVAGMTQTQEMRDFQATLERSNSLQATDEVLTATAFAPTFAAQQQQTVEAILTGTRDAVLALTPSSTPVPPTASSTTTSPPNTPTSIAIPSPFVNEKIISSENATFVVELEIFDEGTIIENLALSPNDEFIAISDSNNASVLNMSGQLTSTLQANVSLINSIEWNPNGTLLAISGDTSHIELWDPFTSTLITTLSGHTAAVEDLSWASDGIFLASASRDNTVRVWDINMGETIASTDLQNNAILSVDWHSNNLIAFAGFSGEIQIWDFQQNNIIMNLNGHTRGVWSLEWSPNGQYIASAADANNVLIWNISNGQILHTLPHRSWIQSVVWSPSNQLVAFANRGNLQIWDASKGEVLVNLEDHDNTIFGLAWSSDGQNIFSAGADGTVRKWGLPVTD